MSTDTPGTKTVYEIQGVYDYLDTIGQTYPVTQHIQSNVARHAPCFRILRYWIYLGLLRSCVVFVAAVAATVAASTNYCSSRSSHHFYNEVYESHF